MHICKSTNILVNEKCYILKWKYLWNTRNNVCSKFKGRGISQNELRTLYHIFDAVSIVDYFPNIILQYNQKVHIILNSISSLTAQLFIIFTHKIILLEDMLFAILKEVKLR